MTRSSTKTRNGPQQINRVEEIDTATLLQRYNRTDEENIIVERETRANRISEVLAGWLARFHAIITPRSV